MAVIDVDGGRQPLANEDGSIWATLNGEIYNHPALRTGLLAQGHVLATRTDTEVLVHLYEEYGDALVHALEGMFAFAVWDARRGRLLVARDRFGEKPLFYAHRGGDLAFASELSALSRALPGADELDAAAVDAYFVHGYVPGPRTIIAGISQLPPGHMLTWDAASRQTQVTKYWEPLASPYDGPIESESELVGELGRLLEESVRGRMLSDVPLGVLLSGGVDSSLVASLVAERASGPVPAFTVGYDIGDVTEISAARQTAMAIGAEHHTLILTQGEVAGRLASVMGKLDQPLADQALVPLHAVSELAREHVTVALGGEGADELFGGYPRYRWLRRATRIEDMVPARFARGGARILRGMERGQRTRHLTDLLEPTSTVVRHVDWVTDRRQQSRPSVYGTRLAALAHTPQDELIAQSLPRNGRATSPGPGDMMLLDQRTWLADSVLVKADRAGMLASLEIRTPYLHQAVAEFAASIPAKVHVRGRGKELLRTLLARRQPDVHHRRSKVAFRAPAGAWLRGPLAPTLRQQLAAGALFDEGWFSRPAISAIASEHLAGRRDHTRILWPVLTLGLWLDAHRNGRPEC